MSGRPRTTGRDIEAAFAARLWEERQHQPLIIRCAVAGCAFQIEGPLGEVSTAHLEHRRTAHPDIQPKPRRNHPHARIGGIVTKHSLDENIDKVRAQGGGSWM